MKTIPRAVKLLAAKLSSATPLHEAAWNGRTEAVTALLNAGATPLHFAAWPLPVSRADERPSAQGGYTEAVTALLNARADPNAGDRHGNTPLHLASEDGYTETVTALLNAGGRLL